MSRSNSLPSQYFSNTYRRYVEFIFRGHSVLRTGCAKPLKAITRRYPSRRDLASENRCLYVLSVRGSPVVIGSHSTSTEVSLMSGIYRVFPLIDGYLTCSPRSHLAAAVSRGGGMRGPRNYHLACAREEVSERACPLAPTHEKRIFFFGKYV